MRIHPLPPLTRTTIFVLLGAAVLLFPPTAQALDPNRALARYVHEEWNSKQGFPGGAVNALAQTSDGYLWIGAENGLVRFNGFTFELFNSTNTASFPPGPVLGLRSDEDGGLWIRLHSPGLLRYHAGIFEPQLTHSSDLGGVTALGRAANSDVLLARSGMPLRYHDGKLLPLLPPGTAIEGLAMSIAETDDHTIWIGTRDGGLMALGNGRLSNVSPLPDKKVNALLPGLNGDLWIGTDRGLMRWDGHELSRPKIAAAPALRSQILTLARDRDRNLWAGTANGIVRISANGAVEQTDAASPAPVNAAFEDREGNLWLGSSKGVERYRDTAFLAYTDASATDSPTRNAGPLYVDGEGRTWFGPSTGGLSWVKGAQRGNIPLAGLPGDVVYSLDGGPGELWAGRRQGGLTRLHWENNLPGVRGDEGPLACSQTGRQRCALETETYTAARGLAQGGVYAVRRARDGAVWAGTVNGGISRISNGRVTTFTAANGLESNMITALEETPDGTIWVGAGNGLATFSNESWRTWPASSGLPPGRINCLLADSAGVLWIGTSAGLALVNSKRLDVPPLPEALQGEILGLADDRLGFLWIATERRVARVSRGSLLNHQGGWNGLLEFGVADGLPGTEGLRRNRSVLKDPAGRIWFSLEAGLCMVDPARVPSQSSPAKVHVENITVDGQRVAFQDTLRVPSSRQRIVFDYVGLSLSAPESVRYRYRLDGFDNAWSEPTQARQAVYTNLNPSSYRFRVVASNGEAIWNSNEASVPLTIEPRFWQVWWFQSAAVLVGILLLMIVYRYRLHQLTELLNLRFEERLAERTRIAQELHDTLLQGFISASMQVHTAASAISEQSPVKATLTRALRLMQQVIEEGRNAVRGLRTLEQRPISLADAFSQVPEELGPEIRRDGKIAFRVAVEGEQRPLHPLLRDEVYKIGREALINAFRHANATHIEVKLDYSTSRFRLSVRDDGIGIDSRVVESGRHEHWGLVGMRERADRLGARLHVLSRPSAGTEIELNVPGRFAFQDQPKP